jgi:hypothetical protein
MLPEEEPLRFHLTKVTLGYLVFYYVIILLDCCFVQLVVVVSLVILKILLRLAFC